MNMGGRLNRMDRGYKSATAKFAVAVRAIRFVHFGINVADVTEINGKV